MPTKCTNSPTGSKVWTHTDIDTLLKEFLKGTSMLSLTRLLKRNLQAVDTKLHKMARCYGTAEQSYVSGLPYLWREKERWTERDQLLFTQWHKHGRKGGFGYIELILGRSWDSIEHKINPQGQRKGFGIP